MTSNSYHILGLCSSGFIFPSLGTDTEFCALLASRVGCIVLDCDYRKAPEYPFPAAYEDAQDIVTHVASHSSSFDAGRLTMGGFSARKISFYFVGAGTLFQLASSQYIS